MFNKNRLLATIVLCTTGLSYTGKYIACKERAVKVFDKEQQRWVTRFVEETGSVTKGDGYTSCAGQVCRIPVYNETKFKTQRRPYSKKTPATKCSTPDSNKVTKKSTDTQKQK